MSYGKDYAQIVDTETEDRLNELAEVRDSLHLLLHEMKHYSRTFREEHIDLMGDIENWIDCIEDEAHYLEEDVKAQLDSVDSTWCD